MTHGKFILSISKEEEEEAAIGGGNGFLLLLRFHPLLASSLKTVVYFMCALDQGFPLD